MQETTPETNDKQIESLNIKTAINFNSNYFNNNLLMTNLNKLKKNFKLNQFIKVN